MSSPVGQIVNADGAAAASAVDSAAQQAQSAATAQPDGYVENVYKDALNEQLTSVATGESSDRIIMNKTSGRENQPKKIKMAIMREYWSNAQVTGVWWLAMSVGVLVVLLFVSSSSDFLLKVDVEKPNLRGGDPDAKNEETGETEAPAEPEVPVVEELQPVFNLLSSRGTMTKIGMFLLGFSIATILGYSVPHGIKKCKGSRKKPYPGVDPGFAGSQCLIDDDCTISNRVTNGVCARRSVGFLGQAFNILGFLCVIIGPVLVGTSNDDIPAEPSDYFFSFFLGFSGGYIINYFLSH